MQLSSVVCCAMPPSKLAKELPSGTSTAKAAKVRTFHGRIWTTRLSIRTVPLCLYAGESTSQISLGVVASCLRTGEVLDATTMDTFGI